MEHKCLICNKEFKFNYLLVRHQNNKISCAEKLINKIKPNKNILKEHDNDINKIKKKIYNLNEKLKNYDDNISDFICKYCNHKATTKQNIKIHLNTCKLRKELLKHIEDLKNFIINYNNIKEELLNNKNAQNIFNTTNNTTNNNTTNNTTNNTNNINNNLILNININSFGKEDLSHITDEDYINCLKQRYPGLFQFIKLVHLNKDVPQNHNIMHTNRRNKFIKIYKDGTFISEDKEEVLNDILNNNMWRLEDKATELEENNKISDKVLQEHTEFKKTYYENDKERINRTKVSAENLLLDNKEICVNTQKSLK